MLGISSTDFWLGILVRILALLAIGLAVFEIEIRSEKMKKYKEAIVYYLPSALVTGWIDDDDAIKELERGMGLEAALLPSEEALANDSDDDDLILMGKPRSKLYLCGGRNKKYVQAFWRFFKNAESALLIIAYMAASIGIVYLNAYILRAWPFAATLTMLQMSFCGAAAHICVLFKLSDPSKVGMTRWLYLTLCVPLSFLYMAYLYGSNAVYDYLPVGYIQLLKPAQAIFVFLLLVAAGKEIIAPAPILNLFVILGSVIVASVSQSEIAGWSNIGFGLMMFSNAAYACYLVGQQLLLNTKLGGQQNNEPVIAILCKDKSHVSNNNTTQITEKKQGVKMDSITTLYFLGPSTAACLALLAFFSEWRKPNFSFKGIPAYVLLGDCLVAFSLNLIQIRIVGRLSALTYMFAGYVKGVVTVVISWLAFHEAVSGLEIQGYGVMLLGQLLWSLRKLRNKSKATPGQNQKSLDPNTTSARHLTSSSSNTNKPTLKFNALIASLFIVAYITYGAIFNLCALVPCGAESTT